MLEPLICLASFVLLIALFVLMWLFQRPEGRELEKRTAHQATKLQIMWAQHPERDHIRRPKQKTPPLAGANDPPREPTTADDETATPADVTAPTAHE